MTTLLQLGVCFVLSLEEETDHDQFKGCDLSAEPDEVQGTESMCGRFAILKN